MNITANNTKNKDYGTLNYKWNGITTFLNIAQENTIQLQPLNNLEWNKLNPQKTTLIFLSPIKRIPPAKLSAFLHLGGNALVAEDFRKGTSIFEKLGIELIKEKKTFKFAVPVTESKLTQGIAQILTDHPASFEFSGVPILAFPDTERALFAKLQIGQGKLYLLSDPSIFINDVIRKSDNKIFTINILKELATPKRTIYILTDFVESGNVIKQNKSMKSEFKTYIKDLFNFLKNLFHTKLGKQIFSIILLIPFIYTFLYVFAFHQTVFNQKPQDNFIENKSKIVADFLALRDILFDTLNFKEFVTLFSKNELREVVQNIKSPKLRKEIFILLSKNSEIFLDSYDNIINLYSTEKIKYLSKQTELILQQLNR